MTTDPRERLARVALGRVAEPGDVRIGTLVKTTGPSSALRAISDSTTDDAPWKEWRSRLGARAPDDELAVAARRGFRFVCPGDREWPPSLDDLDQVAARERRGGSPLGLWVRGPLDLAAVTAQAISIVGSRSSTGYGRFVAGELAAGCAEHGFAVVSGGAYGIDAAGHRGALAVHGHTVAVLAGGVDQLYPKGNTMLLELIGREGLLVSETPIGGCSTRSRFLGRNRIIAALSAGTVVVEAALRSGALSTARWALELGRELMGVPGPTTSASSGGVHELIRDGAVLVTDAAEVLESVSALGVGLAPVKTGTRCWRDDLDPVAATILEAFPAAGAVSSQWVSEQTGIDGVTVTRHLRRLASADLVGTDDRGWWLLPTALR